LKRFKERKSTTPGLRLFHGSITRLFLNHKCILDKEVHGKCFEVVVGVVVFRMYRDSADHPAIPDRGVSRGERAPSRGERASERPDM